MKRWINGVTLVVLLAGAATTGFWFGRDTRPEPAVAATTEPAGDDAATTVASVRTQPLKMDTIRQTIDAYGTVQPAAGATVNVSVPFEARVERILVTPGADVDAGTPLIEVGPTPEAQLQLRQAQDALAAADRNVESARKRLNDQLATNAEVATAEQAQQVAKTQLDSLNARGVQGVRALTATTTGNVASIDVQAGQVASAGTALVAVTPRASLAATLGVEPSEADKLKVGDTVALRDVHAADDATPSVGTIRLIARQVDGQSQLRNVTVSLPPDGSLLQGASVVGELTVATGDGFVVPRSAVLLSEDEHVLFVVHDGKAERRVVEIGLRNREALQVISDALHEGDAVAVAGNAELEDGMAVRVEAATTEPAESSPPATMPATAAEGK